MDVRLIIQIRLTNLTGGRMADETVSRETLCSYITVCTMDYVYRRWLMQENPTLHAAVESQVSRRDPSTSSGQALGHPVFRIVRQIAACSWGVELG